MSDGTLKKMSYMGNSNMYKALSVRIDKIFTKDLSNNIFPPQYNWSNGKKEKKKKKTNEEQRGPRQKL